MKDYLFYADPCELFDFCKTRFSQNVALLHDYGLYEFTILVEEIVSHSSSSARGRSPRWRASISRTTRDARWRRSPSTLPSSGRASFCGLPVRRRSEAQAAFRPAKHEFSSR